MTVASVLGIGAHRVVVKVKRMGGGFGGKESRYVFCFHFHFLKENWFVKNFFKESKFA